jgi:hypothetical protein
MWIIKTTQNGCRLAASTFSAIFAATKWSASIETVSHQNPTGKKRRLPAWRASLRVINQIRAQSQTSPNRRTAEPDNAIDEFHELRII